MALLLTRDEEALFRGWLLGLTPSALASYCLDSQEPASTITALRGRLRLKIKRIQVDWDSAWLERRPTAGDLSTALRQFSALLALADVVPEPSQPLDWWLTDSWADKLARVGLVTVDDWLGSYYGAGMGWWRTVPGLGRTGSKAIMAALAEPFKQEIGRRPLPTRVLAVAPLEGLLLPDTLSGAKGGNRAACAPIIKARHDLEAISCWLTLYEGRPHTQRSYRREAERLLLWAVMDKHKALSSLDATDFAAYRAFMGNPQPAGLWIGPPHRRSDKDWRPFTGPLSTRSVRHAETVLNALVKFLVSQYYLASNPLSALPKLRSPTGYSAIGVNRAFTGRQWQQVTAFASRCVEETDGQEQVKWLRVRLILQLGYCTGLRLNELAQAKIGDLSVVERGDSVQHWLAVMGKGGKLRRVPLPNAAYRDLCGSYLTITGRPLQGAPKERPLLPHRHGGARCLTPLSLHKVLKAFFQRAAVELDHEDPELAQRLLVASAHWLRHTHGSIAVQKGVALAQLRDNLGHTSLATTSQYVHADDDARHWAISEAFS